MSCVQTLRRMLRCVSVVTWLKRNLSFVVSILVGVAFLGALVRHATPAVDAELWRQASAPFLVVGLVLAVFAVIVPWRLRHKRRKDAARFAEFETSDVNVAQTKDEHDHPTIH